ncbi:MAG TPA: GNAT family N-acetyltransferase [Rhizomicrobium sp.]|nr:GNAT family N-acetyltransferase [Rhizomicrobium sp.]
MIDNQALHRFELGEDGHIVFANYRTHDGRYILTHVEADPALRGTGAAARLMEAIVAHAKENNFKLVPRCPYAVTWFARHPEASDLIG